MNESTSLTHSQCPRAGPPPSKSTHILWLLNKAGQYSAFFRRRDCISFVSARIQDPSRVSHLPLCSGSLVSSPQYCLIAKCLTSITPRPRCNKVNVTLFLVSDARRRVGPSMNRSAAERRGAALCSFNPRDNVTGPPCAERPLEYLSE